MSSTRSVQQCERLDVEERAKECKRRSTRVEIEGKVELIAAKSRGENETCCSYVVRTCLIYMKTYLADVCTEKCGREGDEEERKSWNEGKTHMT